MPAYIVKIRKKEDLSTLPGVQKNGTTVYKIRLNNNSDNNNLNYNRLDEVASPLCISNKTSVLSNSVLSNSLISNSVTCKSGRENQNDNASVYLNNSLRPLGYSVEKRTVKVADLASKVCSVVGRSASDKVSAPYYSCYFPEPQWNLSTTSCLW